MERESSSQVVRIVRLIARALRRWGQRDGTGLAASVSFYALFAMAPLLVFGVVVTSRTIGPDKAKDAAIEWLADMIPVSAAESLVSVVHLKLIADGPWWSNVVSGLVLIWATSSIFVRLLVGTRVMFNQNGETPKAVFYKNLIGRGVALGSAIVAGLIICLIFIVPTLAAPWMSDWQLGGKILAGVSNAVILSIGGYVLLRFVPSPAPRKRALFAATLFFLAAFLIGRTLFQTYITQSVIASAYGVASSVVIFLVWIYYMSCGYFIGAALCAEIAEEVPRQPKEKKRTS